MLHTPLRLVSAIACHHLRHPDRSVEQLLEDTNEANTGVGANVRERSGQRLDALVLLRIVNRRRPDHQRGDAARSGPTDQVFKPEEPGYAPCRTYAATFLDALPSSIAAGLRRQRGARRTIGRGYATQRASASSCLYLPVARYACRRRPAASGRILPAAWLGVLASVA